MPVRSPTKASSSLSSSSSSSVLVLDNGAASVKGGFGGGGGANAETSSSSSWPLVLPNCITKAKSEKRRAFISNQLDDCRDLSSLYYMLPFQRGYLVNWDHQKTVWDYAFGKSCLNLTRPDSYRQLIFTEPYFNFHSIQEGLNEILFEEYRFQNVLRTNPADLACYKNRLERPGAPCCLVVDAGYSFTHVVPFINGVRIREAVKRIDVGGKLLTNHLKEIISYRQLHVLDETYVMNACREDCCYVSLDFEGDMRKASLRNSPENDISRDYVLPDFTSIRRGYMKSREQSTGRPAPDSEEQIIRMNNERFQVPELLFHPSDVGIQQMGIPEAIVHCIDLCCEEEPEAKRWLYENIVLIGGCAKTPNFRERVERDVRTLAPDEFKVVVRLPEDPVTYAWQGGASLAEDPVLADISVSRAEFQERGHLACAEKFYL